MGGNVLSGSQAVLGVIGGSGLYSMKSLERVREVEIPTPFGAPSDTITLGVLSGLPVAFIPRHGREHRLLPGEIPFRANVYALKTLGVEWVVSVSAVGSLREEIRPLDFVVPDQLIDRTWGRDSTFFGRGVVAHVPFGDPFCADLSAMLATAAGEADATVHRGGTCVVIEGPAFSTRAESLLYRSWGASVVGMTALPEAKLAREAELCYAMLACATDYDVWHTTAEPVNVQLVVERLQKNVAQAQRIVEALAPLLTSATCSSAKVLSQALMTDLRRTDDIGQHP